MTQVIGTITTTKPTAQQDATEAQIAKLTPGKSRKAKPAKIARAFTSPRRDRLARPPQSATSIGAVAIGATALSLSDLADSIEEIAPVTTWKAYALAMAMDANFIATESFSLFASAAVARATHKATATTKVVTPAMSGIANEYALASYAEGQLTQSVVAGSASTC
jgi:hypothetical protein